MALSFPECRHYPESLRRFGLIFKPPPSSTSIGQARLRVFGPASQWLPRRNWFMIVCLQKINRNAVQTALESDGCSSGNPIIQEIRA